MQKLGAALLVTVSVLAGCATVTLPVDRKVPVKQACGPLAGRRCAPSVGNSLPLTQQYKTVELDAAGSPRLMSYLGTMVPSNDRRGERGAVCGGGASSPFTVADRTEATYDSTVELVYTLDQAISGGLKADLTQAMIASGVPTAVTDRVQADLDASISQLKKQSVHATATLMEFQLKPETLDELDAAETGGRFQSCLATLKTGKWRLYQAVSGFKISDGRLDSTTTTTVLANLAARVKLTDPTVDTVALAANLNNVTMQRVKVSVKPYFVVVGVSFYKSPLHQMIM